MYCKNCNEEINTNADGIIQSFEKDGLYYNSKIIYCIRCNFPAIFISGEPIKPENTIFD